MVVGRFVREELHNELTLLGNGFVGCRAAEVIAVACAASRRVACVRFGEGRSGACGMAPGGGNTRAGGVVVMTIPPAAVAARVSMLPSVAGVAAVGRFFAGTSRGARVATGGVAVSGRGRVVGRTGSSARLRCERRGRVCAGLRREAGVVAVVVATVAIAFTAACTTGLERRVAALRLLLVLPELAFVKRLRIGLRVGEWVRGHGEAHAVLVRRHHRRHLPWVERRVPGVSCVVGRWGQSLLLRRVLRLRRRRLLPLRHGGVVARSHAGIRWITRVAGGWRILSGVPGISSGRLGVGWRWRPALWRGRPTRWQRLLRVHCGRVLLLLLLKLWVRRHRGRGVRGVLLLHGRNVLLHRGVEVVV